MTADGAEPRRRLATLILTAMLGFHRIHSRRANMLHGACRSCPPLWS